MTSGKAFLRIAKEFFNRSGFSYLRSADSHRQGTILDTSGTYTYTYTCRYMLIYVCVGTKYLRLLEVTLKGRRGKKRKRERKERKGGAGFSGFGVPQPCKLCLLFSWGLRTGRCLRFKATLSTTYCYEKNLTDVNRIISISFFFFLDRYVTLFFDQKWF